MRKIWLFDKQLTIDVSDDDWEFLCTHRFYSRNPGEEWIRIEFVTGTGITPNKRELWGDASDRFHDYIDDLRAISKLDLCKMCREFTIVNDNHENNNRQQ